MMQSCGFGSRESSKRRTYSCIRRERQRASRDHLEPSSASRLKRTDKPSRQSEELTFESVLVVGRGLAISSESGPRFLTRQILTQVRLG